jgi:uncharacterized OB-fold protein
VTLSKTATIITSTVIHIAPEDFLFEAPYAIAIVETPEKARFMAQVVDCDPSSIGPGMEVTLEFRLIRKEARSGILCYGFKAVPTAAWETGS